MITVPAKIKERLVAGVKKFQPILAKAKSADINESDTVTIIADMLSDVFGYDKYMEITSEFAVKRTYCDLAIKMEDKVCLLLEVKAIGLPLKENFIKQATDYSANSGIEWVVLTNGMEWNVYKVMFTKPINAELAYTFDFSSMSSKRLTDIEQLYYLTREAMGKSSKASLEDYYQQKQTLNKTMIGQVLLSDPILDSIRKVLKKVSPEAKVSNEEILQVLSEEVIKREVLDGEKAAVAKKNIAKALKPTSASKEKQQA